MTNKEDSVRAETQEAGVETDQVSDADAQESPSTGQPDQKTASEHAEEPTIEGLQEALLAMETKADDHWQRYLRTAAEMENVRKRASRDVEKAHKFGFEKFAADLLNVRDSFAMGMEAAKENATVESLIEGNDMTFKLLEQVLTRHGVTQIEPMGEVFDPELHEAMAMIDAPDAEPNTVVQVLQVGYQINGRLLRAARVMVAKPA